MNGKGEPERYAGLVSPFDDGTIRGGSADLGTAGALFGHLAMRQHFSDQGAQHPVLGGAGGALSAHLLPQHLRPAAGEPKAAAILVEAEERAREPAQPGGTQKVQGIHLPHLQAEAAGAARQGEDQYFLSQMRDELYQKDITKGPSAEGSFFDGWDEKAPGGIGVIGPGALCYCIILRVGVSPRAFW